jgi:hypothetical protein
MTVVWKVDSGIGASRPQHAPGAEDAGAVDRRIQAAEKFLRRGHVGGHAGLVGDVGAEVARAAFPQLGHGRRALVVVDVEQRDLGAVGDQVRGNRQPRPETPPVTTARVSQSCMARSPLRVSGILRDDCSGWEEPDESLQKG